MSAVERDKWDARYRDGAYESRTHPTALLAEWLPRLPRPLVGRGRALDVACGAGRNALQLAASGYAVSAVDISTVALERGRRAGDARGLTVDWIAADLDDDAATALPPGPFDVIVWVRYIQRTLMPHVLARLGAGGVLICEQHLATTADVAGPGATFRLAPGELARSVEGLELKFAREGLLADPDGRTVALAQIVAAKRA